MQETIHDTLCVHVVKLRITESHGRVSDAGRMTAEKAQHAR